jgi:lysozyme family protein
LNDPGGTTRYGLDLGEHQHAPWNMTDAMIDKLTREQAIQIYWRHWQIDGCEQMPAKIGECFFNCATMSGRGQAALILHRTKTPLAFLQDELNVFDKIVARRPAAKEYLTGWQNRISDEAKFLRIS